MKVQSEAASVDVEAAASYAEDLLRSLMKVPVRNNRFFNVGKIAFCQKMSSRTSVNKKSMHSFKGQGDSLLRG